MNRKVYDNGRANAAGVSKKRKLSNKRGFTLAETLLAVLILLLVSVVVATGMPAATNAYNKVILGANAKVMLSTAITALHDEIGTAWRIEPSPDKKSITYFNASTGAKSKIFLDTDSYNAIQVQDYIPLNDDKDLIHVNDGTAAEGEPYHLVSDSQSSMSVTYTTIEYDSGIVTITGLKVCKQDKNKTVLAEFAGEDGAAKAFKIRVISKDVIETT